MSKISRFHHLKNNLKQCEETENTTILGGEKISRVDFQNQKTEQEQPPKTWKMQEYVEKIKRLTQISDIENEISRLQKEQLSKDSQYNRYKERKLKHLNYKIALKKFLDQRDKEFDKMMEIFKKHKEEMDRKMEEMDNWIKEMEQSQEQSL